jgi:hypothetical protein
MENRKLRGYYNADLTLEETEDLIQQKRKEDLVGVVYSIKTVFEPVLKV